MVNFTGHIPKLAARSAHKASAGGNLVSPPEALAQAGTLNPAPNSTSLIFNNYLVYSINYFIFVEKSIIMKNDRELTAQDSLDLIAAMISEAKGNIHQHRFYYLLWGWVGTLINLSVFIMLQLGVSNPYRAWAMVIPAWIITLYYSYRNRKKRSVRTHFENVYLLMWVAFGLTTVVIVAFGSRINYNINPLILLSASLPTMISGALIKFRPLVIGGLIILVASVVAFILPFEYHTLIGACAILCGYIVPGYLLKRTDNV